MHTTLAVRYNDHVFIRLEKPYVLYTQVSMLWVLTYLLLANRQDNGHHIAFTLSKSPLHMVSIVRALGT